MNTNNYSGKICVYFENRDGNPFCTRHLTVTTIEICNRCPDKINEPILAEINGLTYIED